VAIGPAAAFVPAGPRGLSSRVAIGSA